MGIPGRPGIPVPRLDGDLRTDPASLEQAADDFGHLVRRPPVAVLRPGSVDDVVAMIRHCRRHRLPVAARGAGHSAFGQAQADRGLVIDMTPLSRVRIAGDAAIADAGARWSQVLRASLAHGLTPPVLTDHLDLSVGGTLTVGGVGGTTHRHGMQVDNVLELEVVTGAGDHTVCSPSANPDLFRAVLAGLGQCAVIVRATLRLIPAPAAVRRYRLRYPSVAALTADQRKIVHEDRFPYVEGQVLHRPELGGRAIVLDVAAFHTGPTPPDDARIADLAHERGTERVDDLPYLGFLDRNADSVEEQRASGEWARPHPWWNAFLPDAAADPFAADLLAGLTPADLGASGVVLLYPFPRSRLTLPLTRAPDAPLIFLLALLRTASPGAAPPHAMLAANRLLTERVRRAGGHRYPIGAAPATPADWRTHYGPHWPAFAAAKRRHDPAGILAPGLGVFG